MQWFRSYVGTHADPKFATISRKVGLHRTMILAVWQALLECASAAVDRGSIAEFDVEDTGTALDMETETVQAIVVALIAKGMVTQDGKIAAWDKRQFQSDDGTARVRKHRAEKRFGNGDETFHPVSETAVKRHVAPPDTDTDTDTETETETKTENKKEVPRAREDAALAIEFKAWYVVYPKHVDPNDALKAYRRARKTADAATLLLGAQRYRDDPKREKEFTKAPATWLNKGSWKNEEMCDPAPPKADPAAVLKANVWMVQRGIRTDRSAITQADLTDMVAKQLVTKEQAHAYGWTEPRPPPINNRPPETELWPK